jgi:tetratricopeptide (TPR) repeat protein
LPKKNSETVKSWQRNGIFVAALLLFGAARMPFEAGLAKELRSANLTPEPLEIGTRERIGQTSSAVALGGLRTLVATFLSLRAYSFFEEQRWDDVAEAFNTIVDLAPRTRYYWETGSWHQAYNAASYYLNDSEMPVLRRRVAWRNAIAEGRAFIERGIRNNPKDWSLHRTLGFMLADENKFPAFRDLDEVFQASATAYQNAAKCENAPKYLRRAELYSLARVKGKEKESLALARELYSQNQRTPRLLMLLFVLEAHENPQLELTNRAIELFKTPEAAYKNLAVLWQRTEEHFPVYGVAQVLHALEKNMGIPEEKRISNLPSSPPAGPDEWFKMKN